MPYDINLWMSIISCVLATMRFCNDLQESLVRETNIELSDRFILEHGTVKKYFLILILMYLQDICVYIRLP